MSNIKKNLELFGIEDLTVDAFVVVEGEYNWREAMVSLEKPIKATEIPLEFALIEKQVELAEGEHVERDFMLYCSETYVGCFSVSRMCKETAFYTPENEKTELPDIMIDRVGVRVNGRKLRRVQVAEGESLAKLCERDRERNVGSSVKKAEGEHVLFDVEIVRDGKLIGRITESGRFEYRQAVEFRDALGWLLATEMGHETLFSDFDLDQAVRDVANVLVFHGASCYVARNIWPDALKKVFVPEVRARTGDTYLAVAQFLWQVATRRYLGREDEGIDFAI